MALPKWQAPQDWLSQLWNICLGKRVDPEKDGWLLGPIGEIGGIADRFVGKLADAEGLRVLRNESPAGLLEDFGFFNQIDGRINPRIQRFYTATTEFDLEVWTQWRPVFGSLGYLVSKLYSRRIQQLCLPLKALDTSHGIASEVILLVDALGHRRHAVWYRKLKKTGEVVYSGVYSRAELPSGERCLKIIFPLPQGSATVLMRASVDEAGNLELLAQGRRSGDPGFYFLVQDRKEQMWQHYLKSFSERIRVFEDDEGTLRADHAMTLWGMTAYELHYKLTPRGV